MATTSQVQLCKVLGCERPVIVAPMAKIATGELAAAASGAGGFGIIGGGYGDPGWIAEHVERAGGARIGIGLISWNMTAGAVTNALTHGPAAVWLSFGDPSPHIAEIHEAEAIAICQIGTVAEAVEAVNAGADVIVAQGSESGGHGRLGQGLFDLLPAVAARCGDVPLVAAGGITDAAGLQAVAAFGAGGVALGTAFYATHEAGDRPEAKQRMVESTGDDTVISTVYDLVRGPEWPAGYAGRSIRTVWTDEWAGREDELRAVVDPLVVEHQRATDEADMSVRVIWAGEGLDNVTDVVSARSIVERFAAVRDA